MVDVSKTRKDVRGVMEVQSVKLVSIDLGNEESEGELRTSLRLQTQVLGKMVLPFTELGKLISLARTKDEFFLQTY